MIKYPFELELTDEFSEKYCDHIVLFDEIIFLLGGAIHEWLDFNKIICLREVEKIILSEDGSVPVTKINHIALLKRKYKIFFQKEEDKAHFIMTWL